MNKIKLGLIYGGVSTEHEVSISSYESIVNNINKDKYDITSFYISKDGTWFTDGKRTKDVFNSLKEMDCVFPILHGKKWGRRKYCRNVRNYRRILCRM